MEKRPILIMVAMEVETNFLISKLENQVCQKVNKYKFFEGKINNYPIVICLSNVMTINSSVATVIAIQKYNPIAIINEGTAGAHCKDIHTGDIVVGERCFNINSFQSLHKKEGEGSNPFEWELMNFTSDQADRFEYQYADKYLINLAKQIKYTDGKVHFGNIGSGDCWNKETDRILWLHDKNNSLCEDMEGISSYTLANNFNIPVIGIRVISNNEILGEPYDRNIGIKAQEFTYQLILKYINRHIMLFVEK